LWILVLGAASNTASALLQAPDISDRVVVMFHGRSEETWPERTTQFNVFGDIIAAKTLLESRAPLVWFDTGTRICASMSTTERSLAPIGRLGRFLHDYRSRRADFQRPEKGFFDLGDTAWLLRPDICKVETIPVPTLTRWMFFDHEKTHGEMLFVSTIDVEQTWRLFFSQLKKGEEV
jgi:inosine-uridine nucleoside N-ribohydrolase